jgi:hypothetical protein
VTIQPQSTTYLNLTAGAAGVDKWGKMWIVFKRALESTGLWRQKGAGDGLSATTTGSTDIFTSNSGNGYLTSGGTTWLAAQGTANSFSNILAWFVMEELDGAGVPTGRQFGVQRSSTTATGGEQQFNIRWTFTGFSGATSANTAPASGTSVALAGSGLFGTAGVSMVAVGGMATCAIATATTINFTVLIPNASESKGVAPFVLWASLGTDLGLTFFYEVLKEVASADAHPCVVMMDAWSAMYGEAYGSGLSSVSGTSTNGWATDNAGTVQTVSVEQWRDNQGRLYPAPSSSTAPTADADGKYLIRPVSWSVRTSGLTAMPKGISKYLTSGVLGGLGYFTPATFHAAVADAVEPPRVACGWFQWPWIVGTYMTGQGGTVANNRTDVRSVLQSRTADSTPPTLSAFSPAAGAIAYNQAISINVTDSAGLLARYVVTAEFASQPDETIWDGAQFSSDYDAFSTATAISNGYGLSIRRDVGWPAAFTLRVRAWDTDNNTATTTAAYTITGTNPAAPDTAAPVIDTVAPAPGAIAATQAISWHVTDPLGIIRRVFVEVDYTTLDRRDTAFSGVGSAAGFDDSYDASSTVSAITNGYTYSLVPDAGWRGPFTLRITAIDTAGNETTTTQAYTLTASNLPAISNASPADGSAIAANAAIAFRVSDPTQLNLDLIFVRYASGQEELVWNGTAFSGQYSSLSSRATVVAGKSYDFSVRRSPGWGAAPTVFAKMVDADGQIVTPSLSYTLSATSAPSVAVISPAPGSIIEPEAISIFDVLDATALQKVFVFVKYGWLGDVEVLWDGDDFTGRYKARSSRATITNGYRFTVGRIGGWPTPPSGLSDGPQFIVRAFDTEWQEAA